MIPLPIDGHLPEILTLLTQTPSLILTAPPGTGKTTRVPPALLDGDCGTNGKQKILLVEPRRVAVRAAARRMATERNEAVGQTIGYKVRGDQKCGAATRIEVITTGVLLRQLQSDPELTDVGLIILDEFHERSAEIDLVFALLLDMRAALRPDLKLLIMSATLDADHLAVHMGDTAIHHCPAPSHPVRIRHGGSELEQKRQGGTWGATRDSVPRGMADAIRQLMAEEPGSLLAFLPGEAEIRRTQALLSDGAPPDWDIRPLYGALPPREQDLAVTAGEPGRRKVVLATDIAESSLTIDGVRLVVDSGLRRTPRFHPGRGLSRLETIRISKASAEQRRGRAGRQGPGVCLRLWPEAETRAFIAYDPPEILNTDLAPILLETAQWGVADPGDLPWLTPPARGPVSAAIALLQRLGALDETNRITAMGKRMARIPLHPRLAHMLCHVALSETAPDQIAVAACAAAIIEDGDCLIRPARQAAGVDLRKRLTALLSPGSTHPDMDKGARSRLRDDARRTLQALGDPSTKALKEIQRSGLSAAVLDRLGVWIAAAFPDRIAQARPGGGSGGDRRYITAHSGGAVLAADDPMGAFPYLAIADLGSTTKTGIPGGDPRLRLAAPLSEADMADLCQEYGQQREEIFWDTQKDALVGRSAYRIGAVLFGSTPIKAPWQAAPDAARDAVRTALRAKGPACLTWSKTAQRLRDRIGFLHRTIGDPWPQTTPVDAWFDTSLDALLETAPAPVKTAADFSALDVVTVLREQVGWEQMRSLDSLAPETITVPSGAVIPLDYTGPDGPVLAARIQQLFGLRETPTIGREKQPVLVHLLSPAGRPLQVTRDLAGFWSGSYLDIRKDLRGRYPKHPWPEDPTAADATNRVKPRKRSP